VRVLFVSLISLHCNGGSCSPGCDESSERDIAGNRRNTRKADRIMAGQNHAERKIEGAVLNDSVRS